MSTSQDVNLERSLYYGVIVMSICYGLEVYLYFHSVYLFFQLPTNYRAKRLPYILIGALLFGLTTIVVFTNAVFMEFMWIDHRDFEGGPLAYLAANSAIWWQTFGTAANQVTNFIGDGLLLYRCLVIWERNFWVIILPGIVYVGSIAMALITLVQSAIPGSDFFRGKTVNFGVPWATLSVLTNITVTGLIVYRLLKAKESLRTVLTKDQLRMYTGASAILIESALPFSILGIAFAVTYGKNSSVGPAFLFVWAVFCALSPQFIISRVVLGKSWTRDIASHVTEERSLIGFVHQVPATGLEDTKLNRASSSTHVSIINSDIEMQPVKKISPA